MIYILLFLILFDHTSPSYHIPIQGSQDSEVKIYPTMTLSTYLNTSSVTTIFVNNHKLQNLNFLFKYF